MSGSSNPTLTEVVFPAGVDVLVQGEPSGRLYRLISGSVRAHAGGIDLDLIDRPGRFLGEISILLGGAPRATVTTVEATTLAYTDDPVGYWRANPDLALDMARDVAERLDLITGYLGDLRHQYADRADHLGVLTEVLQVLLRHRGQTVEPGSERETEAPY